MLRISMVRLPAGPHSPGTASGGADADEASFGVVACPSPHLLRLQDNEDLVLVVLFFQPVREGFAGLRAKVLHQDSRRDLPDRLVSNLCLSLGDHRPVFVALIHHETRARVAPEFRLTQYRSLSAMM